MFHRQSTASPAVGDQRESVALPPTTATTVLPSHTPSPTNPAECTIYHRNQEITDWYHRTDLELTRFLGDPALPTWARFAKHASYSAGVQLRNIEEVLQAIDSVIALSGNASKGSGQSGGWSIGRTAKAVFEISDLFHHQDLFETVLLVAAMKAGVDPLKIDSNLDQAARSGEQDISKWRALRLALPAIPELLRNLPAMRHELSRVHNEIAGANEDIYRFMAPRLEAFLEHPESHGDGTGCAERAPDERFLNEALTSYKKAHDLSVEIRSLRHDDQRIKAISEQRIALVERGNILATFGEQIFRVEPRLARIADLLTPLTAFMTYRTPEGSERLAADSSTLNWANVYERMGIDKNAAPVDPKDVSPECFPPLLRPDDPRFQGTISQVLISGTRNPSLAASLEARPERIEPAIVRG